MSIITELLANPARVRRMASQICSEQRMKGRYEPVTIAELLRVLPPARYNEMQLVLRAVREMDRIIKPKGWRDHIAPEDRIAVEQIKEILVQ